MRRKTVPLPLLLPSCVEAPGTRYAPYVCKPLRIDNHAERSLDREPGTDSFSDSHRAHPRRKTHAHGWLPPANAEGGAKRCGHAAPRRCRRREPLALALALGRPCRSQCQRRAPLDDGDGGRSIRSSIRSRGRGLPRVLRLVPEPHLRVPLRIAELAQARDGLGDVRLAARPGDGAGVAGRSLRLAVGQGRAPCYSGRGQRLVLGLLAVCGRVRACEAGGAGCACAGGPLLWCPRGRLIAAHAAFAFVEEPIWQVGRIAGLVDVICLHRTGQP